VSTHVKRSLAIKTNLDCNSLTQKRRNCIAIRETETKLKISRIKNPEPVELIAANLLEQNKLLTEEFYSKLEKHEKAKER